MTRPFLFLLGLAVVLGVALGGAFIGGVAVGRGQVDAANNLQAGSGILPSGQSPGLSGQEPSSGLQQRSFGNGFNSGDAGGSVPQFQGRGSTGSGTDGLAARGGIMGTVESLEGNTVTLNTPQGSVNAIIGENTSITRIAESSVDDLQVGAQVRVVGVELEGEGVTATSVTIIPESAEFSGEGGPQTSPAGQ